MPTLHVVVYYINLSDSKVPPTFLLCFVSKYSNKIVKVDLATLVNNVDVFSDYYIAHD